MARLALNDREAAMTWEPYGRDPDQEARMEATWDEEEREADHPAPDNSAYATAAAAATHSGDDRIDRAYLEELRSQDARVFGRGIG